VSVELQVRFPVDDAELSALHHRAFGPDQPETDAAIRPWAQRLERHSLTWVGACGFRPTPAGLRSREGKAAAAGPPDPVATRTGR
jgi:hypothetical protein